MDVVARVTNGQVALPGAVRAALQIREGDQIVFRVEGDRAVLTRPANFLDLAGAVEVPAAKRDAGWDDVIRRTRSVRTWSP